MTTDLHLEPTFANQLWQARKLAFEKGAAELRRHMLVGQMCRCGDCFCCAAMQVYQELEPNLSDPQMIVKTAIGILVEKAVNSGDGFRQWLYPSLPDDYEVNPRAVEAAGVLWAQGKSAEQIARLLYAEYS